MGRGYAAEEVLFFLLVRWSQYLVMLGSLPVSVGWDLPC